MKNRISQFGLRDNKIGDDKVFIKMIKRVYVVLVYVV